MRQRYRESFEYVLMCNAYRFTCEYDCMTTVFVATIFKTKINIFYQKWNWYTIREQSVHIHEHVESVCSRILSPSHWMGLGNATNNNKPTTKTTTKIWLWNSECEWNEQKDLETQRQNWKWIYTYISKYLVHLQTKWSAFWFRHRHCDVDYKITVSRFADLNRCRSAVGGDGEDDLTMYLSVRLQNNKSKFEHFKYLCTEAIKQLILFVFMSTHRHTQMYKITKV